MPKSKKKRPQRRPNQRPTPPQVEFDEALRAAFDSPAPGPLLGVAGLILSIATGPDDPAGTLAELVEGLSGQGRVEASATALAIATLTGDAELRRRVRRELADRGQVLPRWLAELERTEPLDLAVEISTVYRDADQLLVGATVPGGHPLTAVVLVDNELGAFAADGYVLQSPLEDVVPLLLEDADPDVRVRDIPTADARARIEAALVELDMGPGTGGYESWRSRDRWSSGWCRCCRVAARPTCCGSCPRTSWTGSPRASSPARSGRRGPTRISDRWSTRSWSRAAPTASGIRWSGARTTCASCSIRNSASWTT
ncbi:hypothetical protein [Blastococcus brunescens]|uniref:Uncharacterized protein n=1 Tax=Blastococcus brunescens TaxID=1564165 RepID=A0ABZ1AUM9_9ACTN|nr:hypothetical protein [Blastococcus sp. BMG 8361]WRL62210.1 hypothetical protein U6N30_19465 [Blastococcus sp. BMG 8361]